MYISVIQVVSGHHNISMLIYRLERHLLWCGSHIFHLVRVPGLWIYYVAK